MYIPKSSPRTDAFLKENPPTPDGYLTLSKFEEFAKSLEHELNEANVIISVLKESDIAHNNEPEPSTVCLREAIETILANEK